MFYDEFCLAQCRVSVLVSCFEQYGVLPSEVLNYMLAMLSIVLSASPF